MAVINLSVSALGVGPTVPLPMKNQNFVGGGMSALVNFSGQGAAGGTAATGTVTLQVSNDANANPGLPPATQALARWNNHDTLVSLTADKNSSIIYPIAYARLVATTAIGGSGTVTAQIGIPDQL